MIFYFNFFLEGGNSKTTLIINCSPSGLNFDETLSTLRFGNRAKSIRNTPKQNKKKSAEELVNSLEKAESEISRLNIVISSLKNEINFHKQNNLKRSVSNFVRNSRSSMDLEFTKKQFLLIEQLNHKIDFLENNIREKEQEILETKQENISLGHSIEKIQRNLEEVNEEMLEFEDIEILLKMQQCETENQQLYQQIFYFDNFNSSKEEEMKSIRSKIDNLHSSKEKIDIENRLLHLKVEETLNKIKEKEKEIEEVSKKKKKAIKQLYLNKENENKTTENVIKKSMYPRSKSVCFDKVSTNSHQNLFDWNFNDDTSLSGYLLKKGATQFSNVENDLEEKVSQSKTMMLSSFGIKSLLSKFKTKINKKKNNKK